METFVCVVDSGSFSAAARVLNIGQPAVSKAIAQLEEYLGIQLLLRSSRGLMPTEAGQGYYEGALRAINETSQAELDARGVSSGLTGQLKICAAVTFASLHIVPHIPKFLAQNPGLSIDIVLDDRNIDLLENGIDVALRMGTLSDSTMTARRIAQSQRVVLATPAYFAAHGKPLAPEDLAAHEAIIYGRGGGGAIWTFRQQDAEVVIAVGGKIKVSAGEGVRAAVLADAGLVIASRWMFAPELADGRVLEALTEWRLDPIDLWAVYPAGRKASAKARAFTEFVESIMADPGAAPAQ